MYIRMSWLMLAGGAVLGACGAMVFGATPPLAYHHFAPKDMQAANGDRYLEYVMMSGSAALNPRGQSDAVWLLDKKNNKLLATVIDRANARLPGWTEMSLNSEFGLADKAEAHFLMTTGQIAQGQAALYLVETTTGKIGVYTLGASGESPGFVIRRHDIGSFRAEALPEKLK